MITIRKAGERGSTRMGWLTSYHSFSFNRYYDPEHIHFGPLRVLNDDFVAPGTGFGMHPHDNMEIITYVLAGEVEHRDSTGTHSVIRAGDVQRMSAGTGVVHSEYNRSADEELHLLQIWLLPYKRGLAPSYDQRTFDAARRRNTLLRVVDGDARGDALAMHQHASMFVSSLETGNTVEHAIETGRGAYVFVAAGAATVNGVLLGTGDAAMVRDEISLAISAQETAELVVFDLPMDE